MNCSGFWKKIKGTGAELLALDAHACAVCGRDIREGAVCRDCARQLAEARILRAERLSGIPLYSCYRYDACVRTILLRFKLNHCPWLAEDIGGQMASFLSSRALGFSAVTFVPLAKGRQLQRGYNQAELLAREIGKQLGIPVLPLLRRTRKTKVQSRLAAEKRVENLKDAFGLINGEQRLSGQRILLVDDIATTGTTVLQCAKPLQKAGASVSAIVFARA
ncbi:phosphoribosyltransferase family protein [Christensenellaceae bacterium 44-20]